MADPVYPHHHYVLLDTLYRHPDPSSPIPQAAAPLQDVPAHPALHGSILQLHEAYNMLAAWQAHTTVVAALKQAHKSHHLYIRNIRWNHRTYLLADFFDAAHTIRQAALSTIFFAELPHHDALFAQIHPVDERSRALCAALNSLLASRTIQVDLYDIPMPFSLAEAMEAFRHAHPYRRQGQANLTKKVRLAGTSYYMKTQQPEASGLTTPERDQRNEAAVTAALNAWRVGIGPSAAYSVLGADGNFYAIIAAISATEIEDVSAAARYVTQPHIQRAVLAEKIVALIDRHFGNTLIDRRRKAVREIDLAPAFFHDQTPNFLSREDLGSLGVVYASHARAIWEAHNETRWHADGSPLFDRAIIAEAVAKAPAIQDAIARYVTPDERLHVAAECARLERVLHQYAGRDISLREIEQA